MNYNISYQQASNHYIDIKLEVNAENDSLLRFQLPAWRPGRYELGNFAKNIQSWEAFDEAGQKLSARKLTKDLWEVACEHANKVIIKYNYFANELNAGSSFLSEDQLYVNPVNCLIYEESRLQEKCTLTIEIPESYEIACSLKNIEQGIFEAVNFDELVDSPFIASASLKVHRFEEGGTTFYLWFQGECKPDWSLLENDFRAYTKEQIKLFGDFPTAEYHYLFQILPFSAYHGVEHSASTVIALGPSYSLFQKEGRYEDLLGVSSHELFHTWNVKRIRPIEMIPYDFSKENYTRLGYLTEGATTWYGDLMLLRSKVFDDEAYFRTFNQLLDRHFNNPGALHLSVADSSFDTWLDGYALGVPNRKASIYTEGALITFLLDIKIRSNTENKKSFDDVMRCFYTDYYKKGKGISEVIYKNVVEEVAGKDLTDFFTSYVNGSENYTEELELALAYLGLQMVKEPSLQFHEAYLGVRMIDNRIVSVFPDSPAARAGITVQDQPIAINNIQLKDNLSQWLTYFKEEEILIELVGAQGLVKTVKVELSETICYSKNVLSWVENPTAEQKEAKAVWMQ